MIRSASLLLLLVSVSIYSLNAQDCSVNLRNAESLFNSGRVEEVPVLLESCLKSGFTSAEELSAYKLIIRSYLFDDKADLAEEMMLEFLRKYPEYEVSQTDNSDFIYLLNKFRVKPVIQLGLRGGFNLAYILGKNENTVSGVPEGTSYSNDNVSLSLGGIIRYRINEEFEAGLELDYSEVSFSCSEKFLSYALVSYREKQRRLESALNVYYSPWNFSGFIPYFKVGAGLAFNLSTEGVSGFNNYDINNPFERASPDISRTDYREQADILAVAGIGCKYKLPSGYLFVDIDTRLGTVNQSIPGLPSDQELYYFFTDDSFRLNTMRFSLGYIFIIYKPERLPE